MARTPTRKEDSESFHTPLDYGRSDSMENAFQDEDLVNSPSYKLVEAEELLGMGQATNDAKTVEEEPILNKPKRKRLESPLTEAKKAEVGQPAQELRKMGEVNKWLAKVVKRVKELKKLVNENTKTKLEIKNASREVHYLVENLEKQVVKYQKEHICFLQEQHVEKLEIGTQTHSCSRTIGVQVDWDEAEREKEEADNKIRAEFKKAVQENIDFMGIGGLLDKEWPKDIYDRTQIKSKNLRNLNPEMDCAFLLDVNKIKEDKAWENLILVYPELQSMVNINEGQIDYIVKTVRAKTKNQKVTEKTTALYLLPIKINEEGVNSMEEVYDIIKELRETMQVHSTDSINISISEGLDQEYVRKLSEYIFSGTTSKVTLLIPNSKQRPQASEVVKHLTEKVIVKSGKNSYADLLRTVKDKIDINRAGVNIKRIRKTAGGDLMLEVDGDRQKAGVLKKAISEKIENEVRLTNNTMTIHISDVDAATTKEEVEEAVRKKASHTDRESVVVKSIRPNRDGSQTATVQINKGSAKQLILAKSIKIGWIYCRVRERVFVPRCYRCMEFGHTIGQCNGPDRSDICVNCYESGHKARDCTGTHFCPACQSNDHRSDTTRCPKFRNLIKLQQNLRKMNTDRTKNKQND